MRCSAISRSWFLYFGIILVALLLFAKLFTIQVLDTEKYATLADRQYIAPRGTDDFERGTVFFQEKSGNLVSGATLKTGFTLAINPMLLENGEDSFQKINKIIAIDKDNFIYRTTLIDDPYEVILKRIGQKEADAIEDLNISGVILSKEKWRYYPANTMAAHVLGFVGYDGDTLTGRYGLEKRYNDILMRDPDELYINFFADVFSNIKLDLTVEGQSNRKGDVITTIEPTVQRELESTLQKLQDKWHGSDVGAIIIHPKTGRIEAMAALPNFDPNTYNDENNQLSFSNPLIENVYEMGSILKPITVASGLDNGTITTESTYHDYGFVELNGSTIHNYDGRGRGVVSMQEILNQSLNTGATYIMTEMGRDAFRTYLKKFHIGQKTRIDLPNETRGLVKNLESDRDLEFATASFGQGVAITPINMVQMLSVLGNGGMLVTPHVVSKIDYTFGFSNDMEYESSERVISEKTSEEITRMLVEVVDTALRGGTVKLDRHSIAAKTGTAQIADLENGGYYEDKYLHSFFGYFPAFDPEFLIFLYVVDPKEVKYASETLTPPFMSMTKFLINYYEILPDR